MDPVRVSSCSWTAWIAVSRVATACWNAASTLARAVLSSALQTTLEDDVILVAMTRTLGLEGNSRTRVVSSVAKVRTCEQVTSCLSTAFSLLLLAKSFTVFWAAFTASAFWLRAAACVGDYSESSSVEQDQTVNRCES